MEIPHQKIRKAMLDTLTEPVRSIVASQFSATPQMEDYYYDYVSKDPFYSEIHKRWVLSHSSPLSPLPTEAELYRLREDIFGIRGIAEPKKVVLNDPLFVFLLDIFMPFLENLAKETMAYYSLPDKTGKEMVDAMREAAFSALFICDEQHTQKERYPYFINAFIDAFRVFFPSEIGVADAPLPVNDAAFVQAIEKEWQELLQYSDSFYGFEVLPKISPEEMLRYLKLPFANKSYQRLLKQSTYRQINNYVVALATFKPVPDFRLRVHFRNELCALYLPLAENIAKNEAKKKSQKFPLDQIKQIVSDEIPKAAANFDYFYSTKKNLARGKASPFTEKIFPLSDTYHAKLGHLSSGDEFPFTDYLQKALANRMQQFFAETLPPSAISLDDEVRNKKNEGNTVGRFADVIPDDDLQVVRKRQIPVYDARDRDKNKIGWKLDTFAGIIGKSRDTLRRWDKEGLLVPIRYPIYSPKRKRKIQYRAYTREDIPKAKEVEILKNKRARHQV